MTIVAANRPGNEGKDDAVGAQHPPLVTFAGVVLGGSDVFDWDLASGTRPVQKAYTVSHKIADALKGSMGAPQTLVIDNGRIKAEFHNLYLIEIHPGATPFDRLIRIVDVRWLWSKAHVSSTFNLRRTIGDTFLLNTEGDIANVVIQPRIKYARFTINGDAPWTAETAIREVMRQIGQPFIFKDLPNAVEIENLTIDDSGDDAVERVLSYMPGMSVYIDRGGTAVFYDRLSKKEAALVKGLPNAQLVGLQIRDVDRAHVRPRRVRVFFTPWLETRFNYSEPTTTGFLTTSVPEEQKDTNDMVNVAPTPDIETTLPDGRKVARGTWVPLVDLFEAWGVRKISASRSVKMSFDILRKHIFGRGVTSFIHQFGNTAGSPPDPVWIARAATVVAHFRRSFRIVDIFWQRISNVLPFRASIINTETGAFGPAEAYCNWIRRPSYFGIAKHVTDGNKNQGWVVSGYADKLSGARAAPASVTIADAESGIIRIDPRFDPYGLTDQMAFGSPDGDVIPSQDLGRGNRTGLRVYSRWDSIQLKSGFKLSLLVTTVPGSPNTTNRLHAEDVEAPKENGISTGKGPDMEIRVQAGLMPALFGWNDNESDVIINAVKGLATLPTSLLGNAQTIKNLAKAAAARVYETLADRPQGSVTVDMRPELEPTGMVSAVRHVMDRGAMTTRVELPAVRQAASLWRFLDGPTRRAVLHVLNTPVR